MLRRALVLVVVSVTVLVGVPSPVAAGWAISGTGPSRAAAVLLPRADDPSAIKTNPQSNNYNPVYTLTWTTTPLVTGRGVLGYQVRRTNWAGTGPITAGTCAGSTVQGLPNVYVPVNPNAATQSCTDNDGYLNGALSFTVTPVVGRWIGPTSPASPTYE